MSTVVNDPIGDLLTRMRNAQKAKRASCRAPWSRIKEELAILLEKEGWIGGYEVDGVKPMQEIEIIFSAEKPPLTLKRASKPGRRLYKGFADLSPVLRGFGVAILTTSQGLMTDKEAKKKKVGGEVLCIIY
ncbi:MAG: 30S ribosomal protein S8 [Patescibacteria group bacterium]